jgi:histidinol dehydrogenase
MGGTVPGKAGGSEEAHGYDERTVMTRLDLRGATDLDALLRAPSASDDVTDAARAIVEDVRDRGDDAVREHTARHDGWSGGSLRVDRDELDRSLEAADPEFRRALKRAAERIRAYHELQRDEPPRVDQDGICLEELVRPVDRAGCYVPGGRAAYPSTVLMTTIPARVAGVPEVALCVPAGPDGRVAAPTLAAAALVGVDEVYRVGGAQAIGALAFGTATIPAVAVIVGPGNAYVAAAKREVAGLVGIDALAGPSEIVVVADSSAPTEFVAADLVAQLEHGPGGTAVLVTWDPEVADAVSARVDEHRDGIRAAGTVALVDDVEQAMVVVNSIAPEHVELMTADADALVPLVRNAGAVFVGPWAPAALGDYVAGVNHVLPTARTARFASALRVDTFRKHMHVVRATERGLAALGADVEILAAAEGLPAHGRSVALRRAATPAESAR